MGERRYSGGGEVGKVDAEKMKLWEGMKTIGEL